VTITIGQCATEPVTGAAGEVFAAMQAEGHAALGMHPDALSSTPNAIRSMLAAQIKCYCQGILTHLINNGVVTTNVSGGGLQRYVNNVGATVDCVAPATTQQLGGTIT